jgi:hypothetical protein
MFNTRMTSAWTGSCVARLRRIEEPAIVARPRHGLGDVLVLATPGGMLQRYGTPQA